MANITIRKAQEKDTQRLIEMLEAIHLLHHNGRPDIFTESSSKYNSDEIRKMMHEDGKYILVAADENDCAVGYAISILQDKTSKTTESFIGFRTLYLDDLCVDDNCHSKGVGRALLEATQQLAKELNCYNLELNVWSFNKNAIQFYEHCGMHEKTRHMEIIL